MIGKYLVARILYPICTAVSGSLARSFNLGRESCLPNWYRNFARRVLAYRASVATTGACRPRVQWKTWHKGLDFYSMHDEHCDDVVDLNGNGPRWRAAQFSLPYSVHTCGEDELSYAVSAVENGLRFRADDETEHWVYLVAKRMLPCSYALEFDYVPHSVFNEQLQVDFAAESLARRHRFILEFCSTVFYQTVENGQFLQKCPRVQRDVPLHSPLHVRVEVVGNVFCLLFDQKIVLCVKDRFYRPRKDRSFLLFWNGLAPGVPFQTIDFEILNFTIQIPSGESAAART